jgi:hypothetical protein
MKKDQTTRKKVEHGEMPLLVVSLSGFSGSQGCPYNASQGQA